MPMNFTLDRRRFLHGIGCTASACAAGGLLLTASSPEAHAAFEQLDEKARLRFADLALDLAKRAGAQYADIRISRYRWQDLNVRDARLERNEINVNVGFGFRLLKNGAWGFAGFELIDEASIRGAVQQALANAEAMHRLGLTPVELESLPAYQDNWVMPMQIDPFEVSSSDKINLLTEVTTAAKQEGANFCVAWLSTVEEEKFFAASNGSRIHQRRVRIEPGFSVTAVDRASGRFASRASLVPPRGAGYEYVLGQNLVDEARRAVPEAREKLMAKSVEPSTTDLVLDPTNLWLTIHESIGHSTELDRVLGWEADYAGTSFVKPQSRGRLRIGSPLMNIAADRTQSGGLSTVAYDDDGVRPPTDGFMIIKDGIFQNYQMAIGQAHLIHEKQSNGCAYADGPISFPIQRMPNISLLPSSNMSSIDDLIAGVDRGIYIVGNGSWSIDQQRHNFQFGGQLFYEIRNGKRGAMLRDVAYQAQTQNFWQAMDGIGDRSTYRLGGTTNCGKGQPSQSAAVSHGAVPARFRQIAVLNTLRGDL